MNLLIPLLLVVTQLSFGLFLPTVDIYGTSPNLDHEMKASHVPGQVIVRILSDSDDTLAMIAASKTLEIEAAYGDSGVLLVRTPVGQELWWAEMLAAEPGVLWAEPNYLVQALYEPSDPLWPQQWHHHKLATAAAWDISWGNPATVIAIADTGVDLDHPDRPRLWTNPLEIADNQVDDDGNGKVDDIVGWHWGFDDGWNSIEDNDVQIPTEDLTPPNPSAFHGMHVAGIVGALADNEIGVAGIARGPRIMVLRVLDQNARGSMLQVSQAIRYAVDQGARIINLSLGSTAYSHALEEAVSYASAHGVLVVAAAGNDGGAVYYPAALPSVVAVGGTTPDDDIYQRSNTGPELDLVAPATDILSTWASSVRGGYHALTGTSMAAPQVSGALSLLYALQPEATPEQIKQWLYDSALDLGTAGRDETFGWGRLRLDEALKVAAEDMVLSLHSPATVVHPGDAVAVRAEVRDAKSVLAGSGLPITIRVVGDVSPGQQHTTTSGQVEALVTVPTDWEPGNLFRVEALWHDQSSVVEVIVENAPTPELIPRAYLPMVWTE